MANIIPGIIGYLRKGITGLDERLNFDQPENLVVYCVGNNKISDKELEIDGNISSWYIGKMFYERENIYSFDFLKGSFGYLFSKLKPGTKLVLQLGPSVSEILNGIEDVEGAMSFEEQKYFILNLIRKYHRIGNDKIEIVNIEDRHPQLFSLLREKGVKGLETDEEPILDVNNFSSLDIAKYLYVVMSKNEFFYKKIAETKPSKLKESNIESSDYYGMVELAFRIYDFLKGIVLQGGERRQNRYDEIIKNILYGDLKKSPYPELTNLQNFCKILNGDNLFSILHFDSKKYNELIEKQNLKKKVKNVILVTAGSLSLLFAGVTGKTFYDKYQTEKKVEAILDSTFEKYLLEKNIYRYSDYDLAERKKLLKTFLSKTSEMFISNFDLGTLSKYELEKMLINEILRSDDVLNILLIKNFTDKEITEFLNDKFIPNNGVILADKGVERKNIY